MTGLENHTANHRQAPELTPGEDMVRNLRGEKLMSKVEKYGWVVRDQPGHFAWVPKGDLQIDHDYQRDAVIRTRVLAIAGAWCWVALGVIIVARRADGSLWVMDGQHRKLAADKRSDIHTLPCIIFDAADRTYEAKAFRDINTGRSPMTTIDQFKAMVMAGDAPAVAAKSMIEADGYKVGKAGDFTVKCIGTIRTAVHEDLANARIAWRLCVDLYHGGQVHEHIFGGLFYLERFLQKNELGSILESNNRAALLRYGTAELSRSINESRMYHAKGGPRVAADGIVRLLNKGRRTRRIPSVYGQDGEKTAGSPLVGDTGPT